MRFNCYSVLIRLKGAGCPWLTSRKILSREAEATPWMLLGSLRAPPKDYSDVCRRLGEENERAFSLEYPLRSGESETDVP